MDYKKKYLKYKTKYLNAKKIYKRSNKSFTGGDTCPNFVYPLIQKDYMKFFKKPSHVFINCRNLPDIKNHLENLRNHLLENPTSDNYHKLAILSHPEQELKKFNVLNKSHYGQEYDLKILEKLLENNNDSFNTDNIYNLFFKIYNENKEAATNKIDDLAKIAEKNKKTELAKQPEKKIKNNIILNLGEIIRKSIIGISDKFISGGSRNFEDNVLYSFTDQGKENLNKKKKNKQELSDKHEEEFKSLLKIFKTLKINNSDMYDELNNTIIDNVINYIEIQDRLQNFIDDLINYLDTKDEKSHVYLLKILKKCIIKFDNDIAKNIIRTHILEKNILEKFDLQNKIIFIFLVFSIGDLDEIEDIQQFIKTTEGQDKHLIVEIQEKVNNSIPVNLSDLLEGMINTYSLHT